jgi:pimeloyl-ACP methyl ester carboxylesterase
MSNEKIGATGSPTKSRNEPDTGEGGSVYPDPVSLGPVNSGPVPIVFLPGLLCDARLFDPQVALLSGRAMVRPDGLPPADSMEEIGKQLLEMIPGEERFIAAGLSMGGIAAQELVRQAPQRVAGLVLFDTNAWPDFGDRAERRYEKIDKARQEGFDPVARRELLPALIHPSRLNDCGFCDIIVSMARNTGFDTWQLHAKAIAERPDYSDTLAAWKGPALIIAGKQDRLCPPDRQEHLLELLPGAGYHLLDECGHMSTLEKPEETGRLLVDWLEASGL